MCPRRLYSRAVKASRGPAMHKNKNAGLLLIGVGTHLTSMIAAGFILGYGFDYLIDTRPLFMILFGILGFIGGILNAYKMLIRYS